MQHTGAIVDIETTGLNDKEDTIIEIGVIEFVYGEGEPLITRCYSSLQDPGRELPEAISKLTQLTSEQLRNQKIDWNQVRSLLASAELVVAHNMRFEKSFLRQCRETADLVESLPWACSFSHIDWEKHGLKAGSLNHLAADKGFLNPFPHRAISDCLTTFKIISPHLPELVERRRERDILIKAVGSPYSSKDLLRARGYRWDVNERVWQRIVRESAVAAEREFLAREVYGENSPLHSEQEAA